MLYQSAIALLASRHKRMDDRNRDGRIWHTGSCRNLQLESARGFNRLEEVVPEKRINITAVERATQGKLVGTCSRIVVVEG